MKFVAFGDLHFKKPFFDYVGRVVAQGNYDAVLLVGDYLDLLAAGGTTVDQQIRWVLKWFETLPTAKTHVCCVSGNHDWLEGDGPDAEARWLHRARRPRVAVDGDIVSVAGVHIVCRPWVGELDAPPAGQVVLLAHAPPELSDTSLENGWDAGGDISTAMAAEAVRGRGAILVTGHVHRPDSWADYCAGDVFCLNPGCDLRSAVPRHVVVDTDARHAHLLTAEGVRGRLRL